MTQHSTALVLAGFALLYLAAACLPRMSRLERFGLGLTSLTLGFVSLMNFLNLK